MKQIKPPYFIPSKIKKVFLAGSIEMGAAENWQDRVVKMLPDDWTALNPRRDDWDSSWEQKITNEQFNQQVTWELQGIEEANAVVIYFDPATKSPISLLELGFLAGHHPEKCIVVCPEGFWRKGNVDIVCERYGIDQVETLEQAVAGLEGLLF